MKKSIITKSIIAVLLVLIFGSTLVACDWINALFSDVETTADKTALSDEIALAVTEQGDYTADSYNAYAKILADARALLDDGAATQEDVDQLAAELTDARLALKIRPVEAVSGANKSFRLTSGDTKEIVLANYVNTNNLSKISYKVKTNNGAVTLSPVADGKFTITANEVSKATDATVSISVSYAGTEKLTVDLSVQVTNDKAPTLISPEVVKEYDIFTLDNKESLVLDFAENVDNAGKIALTYSVKRGSEAVSLDGTRYTLNFGKYGEDFVYETFTVTVTYVANGEEGTLQYTYKLAIKDTSSHVEAVSGTNKAFRLNSYDSKEITLSDYVKVNDPTKITYEVKADNALVTLTSVKDGKFTITTGEATEASVVMVSIIVSYDGTQKLVVELSVHVSYDVVPTLSEEAVVKEYDLFDLENKESMTINFADNVNNDGGLKLTYSVKRGSDAVTLNGTRYTLNFGTYDENQVWETFTVTVSFVANGREQTLEYTYKLGLKDTRAYRVANGGFDRGLEGWTVNNIGDAPFGSVDNKSTYWVQQFPMFNVGNYFSAYASGIEERAQGTLASPYFTANSSFATYMLGGAGNHNVYITIENKAGEVLAIFRNTKFADLPAGVEDFDAQRELIGKTVFLANFVTYKVDLTDYAGEEIRFVIHDHASEGWGVVFFDELNTYYESEDALPKGAVLAENLLATKDALNAEIALEVTEQGDYTDASYSAYVEKLNAAKALVSDIAVAQATVDAATKALSDARAALTVRPVLELEGATKTFRIITGNSRELALADYINTNGLSKITYEVKADNAALTLSSIEDGKFTVTGNVTETTSAKVSIIVYYDGKEALVVEISVLVTYDLAPTVFDDVVVKEYDIFDLENKTDITFDFAEYVDNAGNLELTYSAKRNGEALVLDGARYTFTFGTYDENVSYETFTVTISYVANGIDQTLEYTYKLAMKNTSAYRVANGNFEHGLDGWTFNNEGGAPFAGIDNKSTYWVQEFPMFNVGSYFSSYADGAAEGSKGTLASPYFTVNSDFATYMLGGAGNHNVYITIENKAGEVLAIFRNTKFADLPAGVEDFDAQRELIGKTVFLANFVTYKVDLTDYAGEEIRFVIHDHASEGWGVVFFDELNTYYESEDALPKGAVLAENLLATKDALNAEIALEVTEQGDYTADSYSAYVEKLNAAKALVSDIAVAQETVDEVTAALEAARKALAIRPVEAVDGAATSFRLITGNSLEITLADYINTNNLSGITYEIKASNTALTLSSIVDGKFTAFGDVTETTSAKVSIIVSYNGAEKLTVELTVLVTYDLAPIVYDEEVVEEHDIFDLTNKESITLDFAKNVNNAGNLELTYSAKRNGEDLTLDGAHYTFAFGKYNENVTYEIFTVTISYVANGREQSLEYTYKLAMKDTSAYRVANGNFEQGLDGWTLNNMVGEAPFAGIDTKTIFWDQQFPMFNVGSYFSSYADGASEVSQGTLASPYFTVNSKYATYMLGGAGNHNVYITIENEAGEVLALYRNTKFADLPAGVTDFNEQRELIGESVFLANFVTYKVDLSGLEGQSIRFVIHDHASKDWGVVFFDELNTYYVSEDAVPADATLAENLLATKDALNAELALEVTEQGDYTDASYSAYVERLNAAKALVSDIAVTQATVDEATAALEAARKALAVRPVEVVDGASKAFKMISGNSLEISLADYINTNDLSSISYEIKANNAAVIFSSIVDGKFTITAGDVDEVTDAMAYILVSYKGEVKLTVELSVHITNDMAPTVIEETVNKEYDVFDLENKESITLDFSENVENLGNLALTYVVNYSGKDITLDGTTYEFKLGTYSDITTYETITVRVSCMVNEEPATIEFTYKLAMTDTSAYRVANGNFEQGLDGWTFENEGEAPFAGIDTKTVFWNQEFPMFNVGSYFSAYAEGALESSMGTLASPYFIVNSSYATYMLGGAGNPGVYITIENKAGEVLAVFRNTKFADLPAGVEDFDAQREMIGKTVFLANFVTYKVDLTDYRGEEIRFVIHDRATENWGVVFFDELNTYYKSASLVPEDAILAENLIANKDALNAEIDLEVLEQGDYTDDSYNAYIEKLNAAKALSSDVAATQAAVNEATAALKAAREALAVRPVEKLENENTEFKVTCGGVEEIVLAEYINTNNLSGITYSITADSAAVTIGEIADGKFTVTGCEVSEDTNVKVTITVYYNGEEKLTVVLTVKVAYDLVPTVTEEELVREHDLFDLENKESITLNLAENIVNEGGLVLTFTVKRGEEAIELEGAEYSFTFGSYGTEFTYETFTVTVSFFANGREQSLEYTYKLGLKDTRAYRVANGNFEQGLDGWTLNNTVGEAPFAGIDEKTTFWGEGYAMYNVGKYFSSYADGAQEGSHGTLASPLFTVNSKYATYMLGGAGNHNVYITIENEAGEVLALYRNTKFTDFPAGEYSLEEKREMIGNTVFLANFVTYKVDLESFAGQKIRFVIHDHASEGWGVVYFDELNTYYASEDTVPESAILAENLLASKDALNAEIALEVKEQGDYTADSYNAYVERLNAAKALVSDIAVTQATVNEVTAALTEARLALTVRPVEEIDGANKSFSVISGTSQEFALSGYVNTNDLSNITYAVSADSQLVTVSDITDGKFTVTAGMVNKAADVTVSIVVSYNGTAKLTVNIAIHITNDLEPTVPGEDVVEIYDVVELGGSDIIINFADSVVNEGELALTYSAKHGEVDITLDGTSYTFTPAGSYSHEVIYETFTVTISYVANGEAAFVTYTYKLGLFDSTAFKLENGGFENGMDGWTVVGNIGDVSSEKTYWNGEFGMDGEGMFSAYAPGATEGAVGTLTSSTFKVGGSGFVTFKLGAMRDENYVYIDVVDAETKQILARYYNGLWERDVTHCTLVAYKANLSEFMGKDVFFRISDNADSDYGLFFADSFITYYANEPEGFNAATPVSYAVSGTVYDVFNGDFEMGGNQGWWNIGEIGVVTNANGYWGDNIPYEKVGNYLFTGVESYGADTMREGNTGTLTSSVFEIGGTGMISFKLGGGGNELCYVQIIDAVTGEALAMYHQQAQRDAVLIQYTADLSAYIGRTVRIQVVDQASSGWGCVSFDNVVTYYPAGAALPEGISAYNYLKNDKAALNAELALEVTEQGDYTLDSFNAYIEKLNAAKAAASKTIIFQEEIDNVTAALTEARLALTVRPVLEVSGANKELSVISGNSKEITLTDYINTNNLSSITYAVSSDNALVTVSEITDGKFTITAGEITEATVAKVSILVSYNGEEKLTVELSVQITNDLAPTVKSEEILEAYEVFDLENKTELVLDLSKNISNDGNLALSYSVAGTALDSHLYTFTLGEYGSEVTYETLTVSVSYVANGEAGTITYTYKLAMTDSSEYRLVNGGFENGLEGWTKVGNIGDVSSNTHYWTNENGGYAFGMDGEKMFSAYAPGAAEDAVGTLTSSAFKIGGSGFITFKLGAAKDGNYVHVEVIDVDTGRILVRYGNSLWAENTEGVKSGCTLIAYKADLSEFIGKNVCIRVTDTAYNDYGLFFADSFVTYYENEPEGFATATKLDTYNLANGSFETGNLNGWTMNIVGAGNYNTLGWVQNSERAEDWYTTNENRKDGNYLFTFLALDGANCENTTGDLVSSTFTLKKNTYVSFRLGGAGSSRVCIQILRSDGTWIASFYNDAPGRVNTEMYAYYYYYTGEEADCYFVIHDDAVSDYGCFVVDDFRVNLETKPNGFIDAKNMTDKSTVFNGSFENGLSGWTMNITEAGTHNTLGWVESSEHDAGWYTKNDGRKDDSHLFTFCRPDGTNCENSKGELVSSTFNLTKDSYVSFRFGGAGTRDVYIQLVKADGTVIATFYNEAPGKANTEMYAYYYQYTGETADCYFRVVDNSTSNYGCFVVDDFRANLDSAPEGFIAAIQ